jgi:Zn-dependent oligopeptidase
MINELSAYQKGNILALTQIQSTIDQGTQKFMTNLYHQDYEISLKKEELNWVSPALKRYLESLQGRDKEEYTLRGDKSILNFLLSSPKPEIRQKYFTAVSKASQENMPILMKILYLRLQKANLLGFENSIEMMKNERAFKIQDPIKAIEHAKQQLSGLNEDLLNHVHMFDKGMNLIN